MSSTLSFLNVIRIRFLALFWLVNELLRMSSETCGEFGNFVWFIQYDHRGYEFLNGFVLSYLWLKPFPGRLHEVEVLTDLGHCFNRSFPEATWSLSKSISSQEGRYQGAPLWWLVYIAMWWFIGWSRVTNFLGLNQQHQSRPYGHSFFGLNHLWGMKSRIKVNGIKVALKDNFNLCFGAILFCVSRGVLWWRRLKEIKHKTISWINLLRI